MARPVWAMQRACLRMQVGEEEEELGLTEMRATQLYVDIVIYFQNIPKVQDLSLRGID